MTHTHRPAGRIFLGTLLSLVSAFMPIGVRAADAPDKGADTSTGKAADTSGPMLTPDRPGFTNGSDTVAPGHVQVEAGVTRTKGASPFAKTPGGGDGLTTDAPQTLIRTGLNAETELRVTLPDYAWPSGGDSGFSDGAIGVRYKFYQSKDGNTKLAFTPSLSIPVRSAVTSSGHVDPVLSLNGQKTSGARWSLSSNLILSYPTQNGGRVTDYTGTGQVTYALSAPLSVFGDFYYDAPVGGPPSPIADGGLTYRVGSHVQLDLETGRGLGGSAPVQFYGGGVAVLF